MPVDPEEAIGSGRSAAEEQPRTDPAHPAPPPGREDEAPAEFGDPGGAPAPDETERR